MRSQLTRKEKILLNLIETKNKNPLVFAIFCIFMGFLGFFWTIKMSMPPPEVVTHHRLENIALRIKDYQEKNGNPPTSLDILPPTEGNDNSLRDGWENPIIYSVTASGAQELRSYGADGVLYGHPDLVYSFQTP